MTARVRRPFVASTSFVLPLALSIRRFTGRESSATIATICSATTTLPCPTFTRCVTDPLPPFARLFKVLRLLPHLLDDALGSQRRLTELEVVGLRSDRVDLAIQLLDQEVQRPAGLAALVDEHEELVPRARRWASRPRACARRPDVRAPPRATRRCRGTRRGPAPEPARRTARRAWRRRRPAGRTVRAPVRAARPRRSGRARGGTGSSGARPSRRPRAPSAGEARCRGGDG